MSSLTLEAIKPPLAVDSNNVIRVGGTRVTLDSIVESFSNGASAEEIMLQFPPLSLADVYTAISYFLHHQQDVEEYLQERRSERIRIKASTEAKFEPAGIRQRLLARHRGN